jgi:dolichol-phosphate mannosyltransferase
LKLSVVIPAHNEAGCIRETITALVTALRREKIPCEIVVVNDNSNDETVEILDTLSERFPECRRVDNEPPNGFGFAVRRGLREFSGDAVAVYMADASDHPEDLIAFYREMVAGDYDCVFGTRWSRGGQVHDYPVIKRIVNRLANVFIRIVMQIRYDDTTNAFKLYRRHVLEGVQPLLSHHFNLTVELPLKAIVRGYTYTVIPNQWTNRTSGISKLKIKEMGSRYLFIIFYCFVEKWLSRGDYHRIRQQDTERLRRKQGSESPD